MRILLDECIPKKLKGSLAPHDCSSVAEQQWHGKKNGELLTLAEKNGFQAFVTLDRGIEYQQNLKARGIAVVLLRSKSNRLADLRSLVSNIHKVLQFIKPGQVTKVGEEGQI